MAFFSILTDVSGKSRLEYEDPRWSQLFHSKKEVLHLNGNEKMFNTMMDKFIENNISTGNLVRDIYANSLCIFLACSMVFVCL